MDSGFKRPTGIGWFSTSGYEIDSICLFFPSPSSRVSLTPEIVSKKAKAKRIMALFLKRKKIQRCSMEVCFSFFLFTIGMLYVADLMGLCLSMER